METITSTQNQNIKELLKLQKAHTRREKRCFIVEGFREISRSLESGYEFKELYFCPSLENFTYSSFVESFPSEKKYAVSPHVFSRIAYRDNHQGLIATARMMDHSLSTLEPTENPLFLVVEKVEKPGNLGALLRTADAAGVDAVFVCDNQTDIYNPNVVRSSLGCLFSTRVIVSDSAEIIDYLKNNNIKIFSAALQDSEEYTNTNFKESCAIALGSEAEGLSGIWRKNAERIIRIPMRGIADSLNVSVSAAILIFEAVRQRNK